MTRGFVRAVWGDVSSNGIRNGKLGKDIDNICKLVEENPDFVKGTVYVFGEENAEVLYEKGFECAVIDQKPSRWDMSTMLYRHKLDILLAASQDYDEIVYLDWDCVQQKMLPRNFWALIGKKGSFQANLMQYRTKKCLWRGKDERKVPNGGFLYIRGDDVAMELIANWNKLVLAFKDIEKKREKRGKEPRFREKNLIFDDEPSMGMYVDDCMGGWKGADEYWSLFEPEFCNLGRKSVFPSCVLKEKDECFVHFAKERRNR